jgi:hypothetical protein
MAFDQPEDVSPVVAEFYRWHYAQRRLPANRLLVSSFIVMEPWWTLRTGSVPLWMVFNKQPSAKALRAYLQSRPAFDEIYLSLFSHGVNSAGLVSISEWKELLRFAKRRGEFLGIDPDAYPRDFAVFVRYHLAAKRIRARYGMPNPIPWADFKQFLHSRQNDYRVQLFDHATPGVQSIASERDKPAA